MIFLPIVERELRVASRQRGTYWTRMGAVLAGLAVGSWIMLIPHLRTPRILGMALFTSLAVVTFIYSLLVGLRTTADCVSEEKREGTLGLLFLTDLRGYDIVFGKLAATSINAFYGMLAVFPILAISLLAGGVTGAEFGRVVLACVTNVLFSLSVGMFCSAVSRDERKAIGAALFLLALITLGLPAIGGALAESKGISRPSPFFFIPSPAFACFAAFDDTRRSLSTAGFNYFDASIVTVNIMAFLFLVLSCWVVPRTWHDKVEGVPKNPVQRTWRNLVFGSARRRAAIRRVLLDINPIYWLTSRDRLKNHLVWVFLLTIGAFWAWGLWKHRNVWSDETTFVMSALFVHTALKVWITTEAARQFGSDRRSGALELLLSTPLTIPQIVRGQLLSLWRQFAAPAAVSILADIIFMTAKYQEHGWILYWITITIVFVADLITLSWVGMWLGLVHRNVSRAAAAVIARVLVLPWMIYLGITAALAALSAFGTRPMVVSWIDENVAILGGLAIALVVDGMFLAWARTRLLNRLREVATQRFDLRKPDSPLPATQQPPVPLTTANPAGAA